jgi:hypothetical protein
MNVFFLKQHLRRSTLPVNEGGKLKLNAEEEKNKIRPHYTCTQMAKPAPSLCFSIKRNMNAA